PDEEAPAGLDRSYHRPERGIRVFQMVNDTNQKTDVVFARGFEIVDAEFAYNCGRIRRQGLPRRSKRPMVNVDCQTTRRAIPHRPIAVAAHTTTGVDKTHTAPVFRAHVWRPASELLFNFCTHLGVTAPFVGEPLRCAGGDRAPGRIVLYADYVPRHVAAILLHRLPP